MSLATRCSHCGTVFKVAEDHLQASEGWVRCGRCREVFNAIESMFEVRRETVGATSDERGQKAAEPAAAERDSQASRSPSSAASAPLGIGDDGLELPQPPSAEAEPSTTGEPDPPEPSATETAEAHLPAPAVDDAAASAGVATAETPQPDTPEDDAPDAATAEVMLTQATDDLPGEVDDTAATSPIAAAVAADSASPQPDPADADNDDIDGDDEAASSATPPRKPEDDARDLKAARVSLFGPDSTFDDEALFGPDSTASEPMERMSLWPSPADKRPTPRTRRRRPKARAFRHDRDFELSETTLDVIPMPSAEAVDQLLVSNERDTRFVEFEPQSGFSSLRRRPRVRLAWRVTAILLGGTLVLQGLLHSRDSIAARWPGAEPALRQLCAPFGCVVDAPRDLQALRVQSVSFNETATTGIYRLGIVLSNQEESRVKMPALDLRITDARGDTLVRRVLTAAELGHRDLAIPGQDDVTLSAVLRIDQAGVSGYDVTVFYP